MQNDRITTAAKSWDTIVKVCGSIIGAMGTVLIIFAVLIAIFGEKMYDAGYISLNLDFIKLYLTDDYSSFSSFRQTYIMIGLFVGGVICFAVQYITKLLRSILQPMKNGCPFAEDTAVNVRKLAWTVLICGFVLQIAGTVGHIMITRTYPMDQIFSSSAIKAIDYSYSMDFSFVFVFFIILFLSYIFSYGQKLQKESDETL